MLLYIWILKKVWGCCNALTIPQTNNCNLTFIKLHFGSLGQRCSSYSLALAFEVLSKVLHGCLTDQEDTKIPRVEE